jgi:hypothetical protein
VVAIVLQKTVIGKVDDVRSQLGDEYEEIFDSGGFRLGCDTSEGLRRAPRTDI